MSLSPIDDFNEQALQKYKHRWSALSRLLHEDRSFSGGERHNAFLNLGEGRFADISAVTGFNFAEDGRALVTQDWDFDGDLDVWVTARTAPRVRLLENQSQNSGESVFIRLQGNGTTSNSDAVGARCEVWLVDDERPLTRSRTAGDSFLSQGSSWLHFGLGAEPQIARVIVHWPAGQSEEFTGIESGGRYLLHQGQPQAKQWSPPAQVKLAEASPLELPHETEQARIVLPNSLLLPLLETNEGEAISDPSKKGPIVINLWSQTCSSCLEELKEWTEFAPQLKAAGLRVLALNTDAIAQTGDLPEGQEFLREIEFPYSSNSTNEDTLQRLDIFQQSLLDRWLPLPIPCSFLVNASGKVAVVYKGPVAAETLLADLALLEADSVTLRNKATPFSGRWAAGPPLIGPKRYVARLLDFKKVVDAERYYRRYLELERKFPDSPSGPRASALKFLAFVASGREDYASAISYLEEAVSLFPQEPEFQQLLKTAQDKRRLSSPKETLKPLLAQVEAEPKNGQAHLALADGYRDMGEPAKAIESYKNALRREPGLFVAAGKLAWILATHPSPEIREPKAALELANRLMSLNAAPNPNFLDLQGIALAANGDFAAAVKKAQAALVLLPEGSPYQKEVSSRLGLYKEGKAYYEGKASK
ncbi:MAG: ASPIC/UnbV domain-containing protein [Roseibacillus sp.]